ncbi:unnamed protein product [Brassica rapa subsp. trilocularis]
MIFLLIALFFRMQIAKEIGSEAQFQKMSWVWFEVGTLVGRKLGIDIATSARLASGVDESASRGEEQHKEAELEHHTQWKQPRHARGSVRATLLLYSLHVVQDVQKMSGSWWHYV